jgi:adenosylcobinamide-GDP ribazoletransferase
VKKFLYALRFLTVIPLPYRQDEDMTDVARSHALFPLIGFLLGLILWGAAELSLLIFSPLTTGFLLMIASLLMTGGLHLDGLSDLADGLGGGRDREKRLEIMKDSRIGAFGALTLIGFLLVKGLLFWELLSRLEGTSLLLLVLPPLWARGFVVLIIRIFPSARPGGMGEFFQKSARPADLITAVILTAGLSALILITSGQIVQLALLPMLFLVMLIPAGRINKLLIGLTGDCYGALIEGSELLSLFLLILGTAIL